MVVNLYRSLFWGIICCIRGVVGNKFCCGKEGLGNPTVVPGNRCPLWTICHWEGRFPISIALFRIFESFTVLGMFFSFLVFWLCSFLLGSLQKTVSFSLPYQEIFGLIGFQPSPWTQQGGHLATFRVSISGWADHFANTTFLVSFGMNLCYDHEPLV